MRMDMIFTGTFWGFFLIVLGISVLLKGFFNIDIPIFRMLFGIFVIWLGISIILGRSPISFKNSDSLIFSEGEIIADGTRREHNVIFSRGRIDLSQLKPESTSRRIEINSIFAETVVYINPASNVKISANSAFGVAQLPDGGGVTFGNRNYENKPPEKSDKVLELELNVVFGALRVEYKDAKEI